jgi:hypothetical protein
MREISGTAHESLIFHLHRWWINIYSVVRDGVVDTPDEKITRQKGHIIFPMLTGREVEGPTAGMYEYRKEGRIDEMLTCLMREVGLTMRVLRGHELKSRNAPSAGIRYDGE